MATTEISKIKDSNGDIHDIKDTTYTFTSGTNSFTYKSSYDSTATTVTVTPSITNNITGSGTSGYLTKFNGANTITNGPQLGSTTTTFLNNKGEWATPAGTYSLPTAAAATLGGVKVGTGLGISATGVLSHSAAPIGTTSSKGSSTARHYIKTITVDSLGHITGVTTGAETVTNTTYSAGSGLTLSGTTFSISSTSVTNAMLQNSSISIAGESVSLGGSIAASTLREKLSLSSALRFAGVTTTTMTDGRTTANVVINSTTVTPTTGDVVIYGDGEYVWTGSAWEHLGGDGSYKTVQSAVSDPTASGTSTSFIKTISQDANGVITASKASLPTGSTSITGIVMLSSATNSTSEALAATPKAVKAAYDLAASKSATTGTVTSVRVQASSPLVSSVSGAQSGSLDTTISFSKTTANYVLAGPSSGTTTAVPTLRALVAADLPVMVGASSTTAGKKGAVPAPATGNVGQFLRGDGAWATPTNTTYGNASSTTAGLLTSALYDKLVGIATGANAYSLPTAAAATLGGVKVGSGLTISATGVLAVTGSAIISGSQTTTSNSDGGNNVYTFTTLGGTTSTFTVKNGTKGNTGDAAGFGTPTATVDTGTGTPSVTITTSGSNTAKVFNFAFSNLKEAKGDTGSDANVTAASVTGALGYTPLQSHQTIKADGLTGASTNRYGVCSTSAATAAKTVTVTTGTFALETGAQVTVKFNNANTANSPTLNVASKGAKNIFHRGAQITSGTNKALLAGVCDFVYDGTQWHLIGNYYDTTTLPQATTTTLGGVTIGDNITVNSGAISLSGTNVRNALGKTTANYVLAGPSSGTTTAVPTLRKLVAADIPISTTNAIGGVSVAASGTSHLTLSSAGALSLTKANVTAALGFTPDDAGKVGSSNVGSNIRPIYLNAGSPTAVNIPSSGAYFSAVPQIGADGVMEIGKYIDFHATSNSTSDYDARITASTAGLTLSGTTTGTFGGTGAGLTNLNASNLSSGTVPAARLPAATTSAQGALPILSGTTTTFLRGDGTWNMVGAIQDYAQSTTAIRISGTSGSSVTNPGLLAVWNGYDIVSAASADVAVGLATALNTDTRPILKTGSTKGTTPSSAHSNGMVVTDQSGNSSNRIAYMEGYVDTANRSWASMYAYSQAATATNSDNAYFSIVYQQDGYSYLATNAKGFVLPSNLYCSGTGNLPTTNLMTGRLMFVY